MSIGAISQAGTGVYAASERPAPPSAKEMFSRVDTNGSGGVDKVELSEMAKKMSEHGGEKIDTEALMTSFDVNEDGELDESEMKSAMESLHKSMKPQGGPPPGPPPAGASGAEEEEEETELEKLLAQLSSSTEESTSAYLSMSMAGLTQSTLNVEA